MSKPRSNRKKHANSHPKSTFQSRQSNQLRIIGGKWRGRKLNFPAIDDLRPTGDRIRETLFNWLSPYLRGASCLDLFSGSGALGLEALSRGADYCLMLEKDRQAANSLRGHIQNLSAQASLIEGDTLIWLQSPGRERKFDVVFVDPPFSHSLWGQTCNLLNTSELLADRAFVYIEAPTEYSLHTIPATWTLWREKVSGTVAYRIYRK